jgi:hypothetical protein
MVLQSAVTVRRRHGEAELVAYYVGRDGPVADAELRRHLQAHLQAYMVPRWVVPLERLPLTINGKLDYRALPEPGQPGSSQTGRLHGASTDLERTVLRTWQQALDDAALGPDDNVFDRGAHSVLAVRVRSELQHALEREIPVVALFQYPTAAALAAHLGRPLDAPDDTVATIDRAGQRRRAAREASTRRTARGTVI